MLLASSKLEGPRVLRVVFSPQVLLTEIGKLRATFSHHLREYEAWQGWKSSRFFFKSDLRNDPFHFRVYFFSSTRSAFSIVIGQMWDSSQCRSLFHKCNLRMEMGPDLRLQDFLQQVYGRCFARKLVSIKTWGQNRNKKSSETLWSTHHKLNMGMLAPRFGLCDETWQNSNRRQIWGGPDRTSSSWDIRRVASAVGENTEQNCFYAMSDSSCTTICKDIIVHGSIWHMNLMFMSYFVSLQPKACRLDQHSQPANLLEVHLMERQKRRRNLEVGKLRKAGPQWSQAGALGQWMKFIQIASSIVYDLCKWILYNDMI